MNPQETYVSVVEPISPAIERVKDVLFRPFDLGRWFVIGFCAWLATLGHRGGGPNAGFRGQGSPELHGIREALASHPWIPVAITGVVVVAITIGILLLWLSSRGKFMFLYCVAENKAEVRHPWHVFRDRANSLFAFRLVLGICGVIAIAAFIGPAVAVYFVHRASLGLSIVAIVALVISGVTVAAILGIIAVFTNDFAVPIMYLHGQTCRQAWATLLDVIRGNKLRFLLYLLFQIVISFTIGVIVIAAVCVTCCIAGLLFMIPYVGTVALLPVIMFRRAYSLCYLAQYGPEYNVFPPEGPQTSPAVEPTPTM